MSIPESRNLLYYQQAIELPNHQKQSATQVSPAAYAREAWREAVSNDFGGESAGLDGEYYGVS